MDDQVLQPEPPGNPRRALPRWPFVLAAILLLAVVAGGLLRHYLRAGQPWTDDWAAPPGYAEMLSDLSAGRADEGERRMDRLFRAWSTEPWRRRALIALGVARLRGRQFDAAEAALSKAGRMGGPTATYITLRRAEALTGARRFTEAARILDPAAQASSDPVFADDLAIQLAKVQAGTGDLPRAQRTLAGHLASSRCIDRARVMEAAAKIAEDAGDRAAAADSYRRLWLEEPRSRESASAFERLAQLLPAPQRFRPSDLPAAAKRARILIGGSDGKGALATWDAVLVSIPSAATDPRLRMEIAEAAVEARQYGRALALLGPPPVRRGDSARGLLLGRALYGLNRGGEAAGCLRAAAEGTDASAGEAMYFLATGLDQNDRDRDALDTFLKYIHRFQRGDRTAAATWRAAWLSYQAGDRDAAARLFQRLVDLPAAQAYHPSALYWLGRAREAAGQKSAALDQYTRLVHGFARDYYGLLAASRMKGLGAAAPAAARAAAPAKKSAARTAARATADPAAGSAGHASPVTSSRGSQGAHGAADARGANPGNAEVAGAPTAKRAPDGPGQGAGTEELGHPSRSFCEFAPGPQAAPRIRAGCELEVAGLYQEAEREYLSAATGGGRRPVWLRLSEFSIRKGDRPAAIERLKAAVPDYLSIPIESLPHRYWEVLYPRPQWEEIETFSRARSLDPALVCGIILQESAFNPLAVSAAGALGLMQILPQTGADAARALGVRDYTPARLLEPANNIRLGTWHFAQVLSRFAGSVELALAAYNAGESRVRRWQSIFGTADPAWFIEEIPYTETRLYVKRIQSHAAMYRAIYGH